MRGMDTAMKQCDNIDKGNLDSHCHNRLLPRKTK
ncbi:Uncharacterised protein [Neisseria gonorrhoeae]|nr:Uncharacterised protein [Neisseria gonorrhoeae]CNT49613.1 Uncharacterised protein [Neisseria gonorrhoeae]